MLKTIQDQRPTIFNRFPREMGKYRKIVWSFDEMLTWINRHNGVKAVYSSIYAFDKCKIQPNMKYNYEDVCLDKVYFDLDDPVTRYSDMLLLHEYYEKAGIIHFIMMSGFGYHVYAWINDRLLKNKKATLFNYHLYVEEKLEINLCPSCRGNLAKISRYPNTLNIKENKFCIPLTHEWVDTYEHHEVLEIASKQQKVSGFIGTQYMDISDHDKPVDVRRLISVNTKLDDDTSLFSDSAQEILEFDIDIFDPCLQAVIYNPHPSHEGRFGIVSTMSHIMRNGKPIHDCTSDELDRVIYNICSFIAVLGWTDYKAQVTAYQVKNIVRNYEVSPNGSWMIKHGLCVGCEKSEECIRGEY